MSWSGNQKYTKEFSYNVEKIMGHRYTISFSKFLFFLSLFHSILMHGVASEGAFFFQTIQLLQCTLAARCTVPTATYISLQAPVEVISTFLTFVKYIRIFWSKAQRRQLTNGSIYSGCCKFGLFFISFSTRSNVSMPKQNTC